MYDFFHVFFLYLFLNFWLAFLTKFFPVSRKKICSRSGSVPLTFSPRNTLPPVLNISPFFHNATLFRHKYSTKNSDYNLIGYNLCSVDKRGTASPLDTPALLQPSPLATAHAPALCHTFFLYFSHPKNTKKAGAVPPIFRPDSVKFFLTLPDRFQQKTVHGSAKFLTSSRRKITHDSDPEFSPIQQTYFTLSL